MVFTAMYSSQSTFTFYGIHRYVLFSINIHAPGYSSLCIVLNQHSRSRVFIAMYSSQSTVTF